MGLNKVSGSLVDPEKAFTKHRAQEDTRRKWLIAGTLLAIMGLASVGLAVGIIISHKLSKHVATSLQPAVSSTSEDGAPLTQKNQNDPSTFISDPRLHQSFYGLAYTPEGSQMPNCNNNLESVIKDVQLMSQLTTRLRLYGADCNQSALVLEAIKQTKVNMSVFLGIYPSPLEPAAYTRQRDAIKATIQTYGPGRIAGVTVGNEYMLNYLSSHGSQNPNGPLAAPAISQLESMIADTKSMISDLALPNHIPVGTAEAGSYFSNDVLGKADYGMSNVHAWFANVTAEAAAGWTAQFFQNTNVAAAQTLANKPTMYIAEVGWPTQSSDAANANNGASTASTANLQTVLDSFVCQANKNGTGYFFFEFFDEKWKDVQFGGVEGWWGLFQADRTLKPVTIPNCSPST